MEGPVPLSSGIQRDLPRVWCLSQPRPSGATRRWFFPSLYEVLWSPLCPELRRGRPQSKAGAFALRPATLPRSRLHLALRSPRQTLLRRTVGDFLSAIFLVLLPGAFSVRCGGPRMGPRDLGLFARTVCNGPIGLGNGGLLSCLFRIPRSPQHPAPQNSKPVRTAAAATRGRASCARCRSPVF